jgi:hypothetical protein
LERIDAAVDGDTVLVQLGTYVENINFSGKLITVGSLFLTTQDPICIPLTIIDGSSEYNVVMFNSGEDSTAVLCGFTITNGHSNYFGGGIYCNNSSPSLQNIIISDNSTFYIGGGILCHNSNPTLMNVTIMGNTAYMGAGIYFYNSSPSLQNVTISWNIASGGFGGYGGGIYCFDDSSPSLVNVTITHNSAAYGGGIWCSWYACPSLLNVTITDNYATYGGGIFCSLDASPTLMNCILWNDSPQEIYFHEEYGTNSITISYSDIQGGEDGIVTNNNNTVSWLEGNIDENPLFVGTGEDPYSLLENSPCIDAGIPDTEGLNLPPWDIIGNLRIWDGDGNGSAIIDMGAYEYGAPYVDVNDCQLSIVDFQLYNYPNPFNPSTTISFSLTAKDAKSAKLEIYNIKGQKVKSFNSAQFVILSGVEGQSSIQWNGTDEYGKPVPSGIYFYKLRAGNFQKVRKMILLK